MILTIVSCLLMAGRNSKANVTIQAAADPTDLYLGETTRLTVRVANFRDGMELDLSTLPGSATLIDKRDVSRQSITIINGRRQVTRFSGWRFQYRITPTATGTQRLGPIHIRANGKSAASHPGPTVNVRPIPQQDTVLLFLASTKTNVIIDESFTVSLRILVRRLKSPYQAESPLHAQAPPPFLSIPYLDQDEENGLESESIRELLNSKLINSGSGFRINNFTISNGDPFGLLGGGRQARFRFERTAVTHNGKPYYEYRLPVTFTPRREGTYTFGPVVFKGHVLVNVTPSRQGQTETIYAIGEPISVTATLPPITNRPPSFIGAIGSNLTVNATLDSQTCYIGDPLTLTLDIRGDCRLDTITAPRLSSQSALQRDFRIYEDTVQRESGADYRQYRYTVRPSRTGTLEFPPIAISFYDTTRADYRTIYTEPLPVRVNAVTAMQGDMVIATDSQRITIRDTQDRLSPAPLDMTGSLTATTAFFIPRLHIPLLLLGPLCVLGIFSLRLSRQLLPTLSARRRRQRVATEAIHELRQMPGGNGAMLPGPILRDYLEIRLAPPFKSATPAECKTQLVSRGIDTELASRFADCLENCDLAAFSHPPPTDAQSEALRTEARAVVAAVEQALNRKSNQRKRRQSPPHALLLVMGLTGCVLPTVASEREQTFEAQRAVNLLLRADAEEDFAAAADVLASLIDDGAANGALFYNYGTCLLMAGDAQTAMQAFLRAERYSGTTWGLRRNMRLARRQQNPDMPDTMPWQRIPLFWHYRLPTTTRMTIAAAAFSLLWFLFLLRKRTTMREVMLVAIGVTTAIGILFGASVLASVYGEHEARLEHAERYLQTPLSNGGIS